MLFLCHHQGCENACTLCARVANSALNKIVNCHDEPYSENEIIPQFQKANLKLFGLQNLPWLVVQGHTKFHLDWPKCVSGIRGHTNRQTDRLLSVGLWPLIEYVHVYEIIL